MRNILLSALSYGEEKYLWEEIIASILKLAPNKQNETLLLKILDHQGAFNYSSVAIPPHSLSPDEMIKSLAVQALVKWTGTKYSEDIFKLETSDISSGLKDIIQAIFENACKPLCIILTGAGMSVESGIPTFRGDDGLWENHKVEDVAEHSAYFKNKELVLRFYQERFENYKNCKPHDGHYALAKLEENFNVIHITQNIDNLLEQAGCTNVTHVHGSCFKVKCERHKDISTLDGDTKFNCDYKADANEAPKIGDLCPKCNSQLRPDIVFFNEAVNFTEEMMYNWRFELEKNNGIFIVIGTSLQVWPIANLVSLFWKVKNKYLIDKNPPVGLTGFEVIKSTAKQELPKFVNFLKGKYK